MERELGKSLKVTGGNLYHIQVDQSNFSTQAWGFQLGLGGGETLTVSPLTLATMLKMELCCATLEATTVSGPSFRLSILEGRQPVDEM